MVRTKPGGHTKPIVTQGYVRRFPKLGMQGGVSVDSSNYKRVTLLRLEIGGQV